LVINSKTRFIAGYMFGYVLILPLALATLLPKIIARHIMAAHQNASIAYNLRHVEPYCIVAEMADGSLRYVEDPFPVDI
jgi:hypothetical protein